MPRKTVDIVPSDEALPKKSGRYITNFGLLEFKDGKFLIQTGNKKLPAIVEWWVDESEALVILPAPTEKEVLERQGVLDS